MKQTKRKRDNLERKNHFKTHNNKIEKFKNLEGKNESRFQNFQIRMKIKIIITQKNIEENWNG